MRGIDTNILVRCVVHDDAKQAAKVEEFWVECQDQGSRFHPGSGFVRASASVGAGPALRTNQIPAH
jgi:predicted nucleic-acid-binding protein